jgi:TRAP-type C4-dicarboxylate transport system permease small subunit
MLKLLRAFNILAWRLDWLNKYFSFTLLIGVFFCIMMQVFFNYVLGNALSWSQELSRILLVWLTFFGAALVTRRSLHIGLTMVIGLLPPRVQNVFKLCGYGIALFFIYAIIFYGWKLSLFGRAQTLSYLDISYFWCYLGLPLGSSLIFIQVVYLGLKEILFFLKKEASIKEFEPEQDFFAR